MESDEEEEVHVALHFTPGINPVDIPVPHFDIVKDYDPDKDFGAKKFERNAAYIRFKGVDEDVDYELDTDDEPFLKKLAQEKVTCADNKFELIMDRLEKESAQKGGSMVDIRDIEKYDLKARPNVLQAVHKHWWDKRKRIGNALLRKFQTPTSINDLSPLATFRPREKEKVHRKTRRNDADALNKLKQLRLDFDRSRTLLEVVTRREKLKKDILIMTFKIQNAENDQAWDFLDEDHTDVLTHSRYRVKPEPKRPLRARNGGKIKPGFKMEGEDDIEGYCSSASTTTSSDWSDTSSPRASPSKIVSPSRLRRRFDTSEKRLLPMDDDLKLSAASTMMATKRPRRYTGRGRVGRGGRIIFDRALRLRHQQMQEALQLGLKPTEVGLYQLQDPNGPTSVEMNGALSVSQSSGDQATAVANGFQPSINCTPSNDASHQSAEASSQADQLKTQSAVQPMAVDSEMVNGIGHGHKPDVRSQL
jgi:hypothetical protein